MNGLWIKVIGVDLAAVLGRWYCEWSNAREHIIQYIIAGE